ncbi:hypothetical protein PP459_gp173 [Streptomyces phage Wakanda]|uniref:Uncharacterized protein n=2 Tax=Wakandavirus TaxID=3044854 RepID=A0A6G8R342_9CAUD|nr:hypothetical protein PP459_gp173 [Streptomyces phage Wakanda]YP_010652380.1 hypothetical protein PP460_gp178 [Streptomyces phage Muntaha]QIN94060.1 hypothetical protein SEA_WAKANDA_68 [Streptomyces phage Wakanda]QIN94625.1 hypothetical protein SEA_MUNTAHA_69 [Streptomyces phage Muntaha]
MRTCAYVECGLEFEPKTHNQRYCSDDCCRRATNARLMKQYYERKARRQGRIRVCANPKCETRLSRYNDGKVCQGCAAAQEAERRQQLLNIVGL